jgi:hypothetical protein
MNPNREELLFQLALTKAVEERAPWLDRECGRDAALRTRLEALLAAHEQPDPLLTPAAEAARPTIKLDLSDAPDEAVGQTLGRYKLLERVGEGGCGVVYVAEQTEPVRRRVALKVIKLAMDTKQVVAIVRAVAVGVEGVLGIEKGRIRKQGLYLAMDIHVRVDADLSVWRGHEISHAVKDRLISSQHRIDDVTVHIEPCRQHHASL